MTPVIPSWRSSAIPGISLAVARAASRTQIATVEPEKSLAPGLQQIIRPNVRDRWMGANVRQYTPDRVEQVLRSAIAGNLVAQWELFDLMEDTWPHLVKNLNELKRAVKAYARTFEGWSEEDEAPTPEADQRAKLVSRALWTMRPRSDENQNGFDDTIYDILDAWGKGISVLEIDWEVRNSGKLGNMVAPQCTRWIHPRFYGYPADANWLGLNTQEIALGDLQNVPPSTARLSPVDGIFARFPPDKFLVCVCKAKTGHPSVTALLRPLAFWWAASNFGQRWFLNLAQIFGLPIRWANYDPNVPGLMEKVAEMLQNMGSEAWAAFPSGTTMELLEGVKSTSENPQVALLDRANQECDILILGQTLTTATPAAGGGSRAQGEVHLSVRNDVVEAAAEFVATVLNQQFIPAIVRLNYGNTEFLPEVCLEAERNEDKKQLAETLEVASRIGVQLPTSFVHKRLDIPLPAAGEAVLEPRSLGPDPLSGFGASPRLATASARQAPDATDKLVDHTLENLTQVEARWLGAARPPVHRLIAAAKSGTVSDAQLVQAIEELVREMPELFHELDTQTLATALQHSLETGFVNGAARGFMRRPSRITPHASREGGAA